MKQEKPVKKRLANRLLKSFFSIYLVIAVLITLTQMFGEYQRTQNHIKTLLASTETIFSDSLTTAVASLDSKQLNTSLNGILKMPAVVGIKIDDMNKPSDWKQAFPIRLGTIADDVAAKPYLQLIAHSFQLQKNNTILANVTVYSSNEAVFNLIKYNFLWIVVAAVIKTIVLWLLFIWAFNRILAKPLLAFCQTMDNVDIDNPDTSFLKLRTDDIEEFCHIEQSFNHLVEHILAKKQISHELNADLEQKVALYHREIELLNIKLKLLSIGDSLTGLASRDHFDEILFNECDHAEQSHQDLALMMIDIDLFKKYKEHYGDQASDDCLINVANILKTHAHRSTDFVIRYADDKFAFIAPATDPMSALCLATEICNTLSDEQLPHESSPFGIITLSVGVAAFVSGETAEALIKKAEAALIDAKQKGRNQVVLSDN